MSLSHQSKYKQENHLHEDAQTLICPLDLCKKENTVVINGVFIVVYHQLNAT